MIDVVSSEGVGVVTLARPEARNALSVAMIAALTAALSALDADDTVGAVILTGADPAFCAGLDLSELGSTGSIMADEESVTRRGGPIPALGKPLIGAINGPAITGGLELALNCDFLVASERARFGDTHAQVGVQPGWGATVLLTQAIGVRRARELSFTGRFVDAGEALRIGLVNHVVAHDRLLPFCVELAAAMAKADPAALRRLRQTYREVADAATADGWEREAAAAREWRGRSFDPAAVERRRGEIRRRGREQVSSQD